MSKKSGGHENLYNPKIERVMIHIKQIGGRLVNAGKFKRKAMPFGASLNIKKWRKPISLFEIRGGLLLGN